MHDRESGYAEGISSRLGKESVNRHARRTRNTKIKLGLDRPQVA